MANVVVAMYRSADTTRQRWIQRITFAAETNADTQTHTDTQRDAERHNTFSAR